MASIFSLLPNDLIMCIIKTAEDERKEQERETRLRHLKQHKNNFSLVIFTLHAIEEELMECYTQEERDDYESENDENGERRPEGCFILGDLFYTIDFQNREYKKDVEEAEHNRELAERERNDELAQERQAEEEYDFYNNDPEPTWA